MRHSHTHSHMRMVCLLFVFFFFIFPRWHTYSWAEPMWLGSCVGSGGSVVVVSCPDWTYVVDVTATVSENDLG